MKARRRLDLTEQRNQFLDRVRFNLDIDTATPILVDNNLARAEVTADLRVLGSPYEPGLSGRLTVSDEGEITLNERRYEVERGDITFVGERRIEPSFDLLLNTTAAQLRHHHRGHAALPGDTETTLTADPTLPEPDIMALLVTGRTLEEMRGEEYEVAREQVLSYLAGRVGSQLGRGLERATGLSTVRIEPNLIANETEPTARLTVGQEITDELELVYSTNLTDSSDQIWVADYDVTRRFETTARAAERQQLPLRLAPRRALRRPARAAPDTASTSDDQRGQHHRRRPCTERGAAAVARRSTRANNTTSSRHVMRWKRIEEELEERGRLQSRVRLQREGDDASVAVTLRVVAGPRVDLVFEGATPSGKVLDEVRTKWRRGVFDTQRIDDSVDVLRAWLMRDNYLQPKVEGTIQEIGAGSAARAIPHRARDTLQQRESRVRRARRASRRTSSTTSSTNRISSSSSSPIRIQVTELLERYYREQGYLVADDRAAAVRIRGNASPESCSTSPKARASSSATSPRPATPSFRRRHSSASLPVTRATRSCRLRRRTRSSTFAICTGAAATTTCGQTTIWCSTVTRVAWTFASRSSKGRRASSPASPFRAMKNERAPRARAARTAGPDTARSRRPRPLAPQPLRHRRLLHRRHHPRGTARPANGASKPVHLNVSVREVQPIQLRYGASYDTERGLGGILDLSNHNSLGKARVIGLRARYDGAAARSARLHQPAVAALLAHRDDGDALLPRGAQPRPSTHAAASMSIAAASRFSRRRKLGNDVRLELGLSLRTGAQLRSRAGRQLERNRSRVAPLTHARSRAKQETKSSTRPAARSGRTRSRFRPRGWARTTRTSSTSGSTSTTSRCSANAANGSPTRSCGHGSSTRSACASGWPTAWARCRCPERALLRGRQHDAPRLRAQRRRTDRHRWSANRRRCDARDQQRASRSRS